MPDIPWPVDLVHRDTGATCQARSMRELNEIRYSGPWRLKRAIPGLGMAVAEPTRAESPREVTSWRGQDTPAAEPGPADGAPVEPVEPEPVARPSRTRKTRKG